MHDKLWIASNLEYVCCGPSAAENEIRSIVWNDKSEPPAKINPKIFRVEEMIPGNQPILEIKNFIGRAKLPCNILESRFAVLDEAHLLLRNRLVQGQALPRNRSSQAA